MKQTEKGQKGFTLIELLVSVFILMMLTTIMMANFRVGERAKRATAAKDIVMNAVRNAQNYTLTSRQIASSTCAPGGVSDKSAVNYRVLLVSTSATATLYAEDKCATLTAIETYALPVGTMFTPSGFGVTTTGGTANQTTVQIKFTAPFAPTAYANTTGVAPTFSAYQSIAVNVTDSNGGNARTVTVDGISGRIE